MNSKWKNNAWDFLKWGALALVVVGAFWYITQQGPDGQDPGTPYKTFLDQVKSKQISKADLNGRIITGVKTNGEPFTVYIPAVGDNHLIDDLLANNVIFTSPRPPEPQSLFMQILISWAPFLLIIVVWVIYMRRSQGAGGRGPMGGFGQNKAKLLEESQLKITFADVAGCEEAKEEVSEIADILKDPAKVTRLGGTIPRGILMIGPPGTGKTLLARAIAGEAKVSFFTISGSDFVEMYVGVGASRVRDMFTEAKKRAPCIVFIDEIDAIGRQRGRAQGGGGGNDEREQTLNQLLVEMDGFDNNTGIIIIAATNRADVLDQALLRPGRFDRQVTVGLPDVKGREQILGVHIKKVPVADDVELKYIAQGTPGFSGADLANIVNEAALLAARTNKQNVGMADLEKAKDKILMGAERHTMVMDPEELRVTAYHEAGHCIVGQMIPKHDPTYKVSIMPRGRALGITMFLPEKDEYSASKRKLDGKISSLYGGRIAEYIIGGEEEVTTGASNDIERATELARNMVTKWGLSKILGPLKYAEEEGKMFPSKMSPETEAKIEAEIRAVIDRNYERAETILKENIDILHSMAAALMKYETIDKGQIDDLMNRRPVRIPEGWDENNSRSSLAKKQVILEKGNSESIQGS